ncbi:dTDP-4-dehydrorhamnose reductase [uncultured Merdimonas sp.]|uniref:dTDP-4-dehydrorhamnose reductase n=1 Tax=uncultured Merdimonas sp. TaxID=2023269 RepID=UPI0032092850
MKTILITGCQGQLGRALNDFYASDPKVRLINTDVGELNITDREEVLRKVREMDPDIIINCAAHTQVDACETDQERAYQINAAGPYHLSLAANETDAVMVHISSDYVFDGTKEGPYVEGDPFHPQSVYGRTKLEGEELVRRTAKKYFVVRTEWLYGEGRNFVNTMLKLSESHEEVRVVNDQFGGPTSAEEVVKVIDLLCRSEQYGTYHASCDGVCSWAQFTEKIYELCGRTTRVIPVSTEEYAAPAKRPKNSVLKNQRLEERFGYHMPDWEDALKKYLTDRKLIVKEQ